MNKIEQLKSDIEKIEKGINSSTTPEQFKEPLRKTLKEKKDELDSLMKAEKQEPKKQEVKKVETIKKEAPVKKQDVSEKKSSGKSSQQILDDCREILSRHNKQKKSAVQRVKERKKQGKPATLTPSETVSKTAKSVKSKVIEMKDKTDKGLPISEVNKLSSGIVATVKSTLSGIKNNFEKQKFLNELIQQITSLKNNLTKVAMQGGLFEYGGGLNLLADTSGAGLQDVGGTSFSDVDLTSHMDLTHPMFAQGGNVGNMYKGFKIYGTSESGWYAKDVEKNQSIKPLNRMVWESKEDVIDSINNNTYKPSFADGGRYNTGRSWTLDRNQHNKSESYEVPKSDRKFGAGGINMGEYFEKKKYSYEEGGSIADSNTEMLMSKIRELQHHTSEIQKLVNSNTKVEAWVVAKAERSATDLSDITHYIDGKKSIDENKFADGGRLASVEVMFENPEYNYSTSVNPNATEQEIRKYFVGNMFDMGVYPSENFQKVIDIKYKPNNNYAHGGLTEHGLKIGDKIIDETSFSENGISVMNDGRYAMVDLDKGERIEGIYAKGGGVDNLKSFDFNEEGNLATTINGKYYEIIYRDDKSQMYDLFENGKKIKSSRAVRDVMTFAEGGEINYKKIKRKGEDEKYGFKYIVREEGNNYVIVEDEKIEKWENSSPMDRKMYYEDLLPKEEVDNEFKFFADGGGVDEQEDMGVQFIDYKDKMIMYEPHYKEYYTNDIQFDSLEKAKKYIDNGSKMTTAQINLYRKGAMANGGSINKYFLRWDSINSRGGVNRNNKELSELPKNIVVNQSNYVFIKKDTINGKDYVPVRIIGGFKGVQLSEQEVKDKKIKRIETMEFAKGGKTTFNDKAKAIAKSLLKRKKVAPSVQKDYGKTYDKKEAVDSAKRIAGAMRKKEMAKKKS